VSTDVLAQSRRLYGIVLAGGDSSRMKADKGALSYHGMPQALYLQSLLSSFCETVFVSIGSRQRQRAPYEGLRILLDDEPRAGPASGLLAAHNYSAESAWFAIAVDLARLDTRLLPELLGGRRPTASATAMRNAQGVIEPLFAIWEPSGLSLLRDRVAEGDASPRRCLESGDVEIVPCSNPSSLLSIDTPQARDAVLRETQKVPR